MTHDHKWECSNIPGMFKCVEKLNTKKCSAIRTFDRFTQKYTTTKKEKK